MRGRPRSFDDDTALESAISVFWEHGYEGTSIAMLTEAMGIAAPSLYNAFNDKKGLFLQALDRYLSTYAAFTTTALSGDRPAYDAVAQLLGDAAVAYTRPDQPPGCLLISAATNCTPTSAGIAEHLRAVRTEGREALAARLRTARDEGDLPADADPDALATFYAATLQGMSGQARDGATRDDLRKIATAALRAWPGVNDQQRSGTAGLAGTTSSRPSG